MTKGAEKGVPLFPPFHETTRGALPSGSFATAELLMQRPLIVLAVSAALALLGSHASRAADRAIAAPPQPEGSAAKSGHKAAAAKLVDLNVASRTELKALPGIGDAEVAKIVANRPYLTKTDLVTKNVLTLQAYDALRSGIVVVHKGPPAKRKP